MIDRREFEEMERRVRMEWNKQLEREEGVCMYMQMERGGSGGGGWV